VDCADPEVARLVADRLAGTLLRQGRHTARLTAASPTSASPGTLTIADGGDRFFALATRE
jgi:hypothetical protein